MVMTDGERTRLWVHQRSQQSHIIYKRDIHFMKVGYSELLFSANSSQNLPLSDWQYPYTRPARQPHGMRPGYQVWLQEFTLVFLLSANSYGVFELQFALKEPTRCYCLKQHSSQDNKSPG